MNVPVPTKHACPLCRQEHASFYCEDKRRTYLQCENCHLVFVPNAYHLTAEQEKAEYDLHDNSDLTAGYVSFLERAITPLYKKLEAMSALDSTGLDFGCGEGMALSRVAAQRGLTMQNYDLYYHPDPAVLDATYQFITMTEVLEHIARPDQLIPDLLDILSDNGLLVIMTKRVIDPDAFSKWHYKNDQTHICFYSEASFEWLAQYFNLSLHIVDSDVVMLQKR